MAVIVAPEQVEILRQEAEWRKCAKSPVYFTEKYAMMWEKEGGDPIDWEPWECQKDALNKFTKHRLIIMLKTRQLGMSWTACSYTLWKILFTPNFHAYFQSIGRKEVGEQVERIKFIYDNLPDWMHRHVQMGGRGLKENDSLIQFSNGSALHAVATTKRAGHGAAPGLYILDEFARNEQDVMTWRAVKPALAAKGQVIVISTSNGRGSTYHSLWEAAEKGKNSLEPIFYPASAHPDYTPEFLEAEKEDYAGDLVGFYEAYPNTPEEAFMSSARCPFDQNRIRESLKHSRKPVIGRLRYDERGKVVFQKDDKGSLMVWEHPKTGEMDENRRPTPQHLYAIGADVSQGLTNGDYSAAVVIDSDTQEVVALYRNKIAPEFYAHQLKMLGTYYNTAQIAVEVNAYADLIMDDLKASYPNIYCRERRERIYDTPTLEPGFRTTASSKPRIITQLRRAFSSQEKPLRIYSTLILDEMSGYEEDDRGKLGAAGDGHDDTVMALAIAVECDLTMPKYKQSEYVPKHRIAGSMSL